MGPGNLLVGSLVCCIIVLIDCPYCDLNFSVSSVLWTMQIKKKLKILRRLGIMGLDLYKVRGVNHALSKNYISERFEFNTHNTMWHSEKNANTLEIISKNQYHEFNMLYLRFQQYSVTFLLVFKNPNTSSGLSRKKPTGCSMQLNRKGTPWIPRTLTIWSVRPCPIHCNIITLQLANSKRHTNNFGINFNYHNISARATRFYGSHCVAPSMAQHKEKNVELVTLKSLYDALCQYRISISYDHNGYMIHFFMSPRKS